jgi:hypothetical protein
MKSLARYLEIIVDPTFDNFYANRTSKRLAYLTCVAIFHSVDRVAEETGKKSRHFRQKWSKESLPFKLVDILAHHLKHVESEDERNRAGRPGISIGVALGFGEDGEGLDVRNLYYVIRDAVKFVHSKAGTIHPKLP